MLTLKDWNKDLDPQASAIRADQDIIGINLSFYDFKASFYADYALLKLSTQFTHYHTC